MARGERIGDAYIKVHADGSGMNKDLAEQLRKDGKDREKIFESQGRREGDAYWRGFMDEGTHRGNGGVENQMESLVRNFDEIVGRSDAAAQWSKEWMTAIEKVRRVEGDQPRNTKGQFAPFLEESFKDSFVNNFGKEVADKFFNAFEKELNSGKIGSHNDVFKAFGLMPDPRDQNQFEASLKVFRGKITKFQEEVAREDAQIAKMLIRQEKFLNSERVKDEVETSKQLFHLRQLEAKAAIASLNRQVEAEAKASQKEREDHDRRFESYTKFLANRRKVEESYAKDFAKRFNALNVDIAKFSNGETVAGTSATTLRHRVDELARGMAPLHEGFRLHNGDLVDAERLTKVFESRIAKADNRMSRFASSVDKYGLKISHGLGKAFGAGSRNDFFNIIGKGIEGVLTGVVKLSSFLVGGLGKAFDFISGRASTVAKEFDNVTVAAEGVAVAAGESAAKSAVNWQELVAQIASAVAIFAAVTVAAGVLGAALSGLTAIITALVAVVAIGLVGAIGAFVGALAPAIASIGVLVLAFKSLGKSKLKEVFHPVTQEFKELGKAAAGVLEKDIHKWAADLVPIIHKLRPAVLGLAHAVGDTLTNALDSAAKSKGFQRFADAMNNFLPSAARKLGKALTNALGGFGGVLRALIPLTNRFLHWLVGITGEFDKWANSVKGQKALRKFFHEAGDAAASLGNFLGHAVIALGTLLRMTAPGGETILGQLSDAAEKFVTWLTSKEGKKSIKDWMDWATTLAPQIGDMVVSIAKFIGALDDPGSRKALSFIINGITSIANTLSKIPNLGTALAGLFAPLVLGMGSFFVGLTLAIEQIKTLGNLIKKVPSLPDIWHFVTLGAQAFLAWLRRVQDKVINMTHVKDLFDIVKSSAATFVQKLIDIKNKINNIPIVADVFSAVKATADAFKTVVQWLINHLAHISVNIDWPSPPAWVNKVLGGGLSLGGGWGGGSDPSGTVGSGIGSAVGDKSTGTSKGSNGRQIVVPSMTIVSPSADPRAVANEVVNHLVAQAY